MVNNVGIGGLKATLEQVWKNALGILTDIGKLFALEVKLAGKSLTTIVVMAIFVLFLLLACWFALLAIVILWLISHMNITLALLTVIGINFALLLILGFYIKRLYSNLNFKETRDQLASLTRSNHESH
jgi:hypothetical protein